MLGLIAGTKVIVNKNCKAPLLRGMRGVVIDEPNKKGNWGVYIRGDDKCIGCELWFSEDELTVERR